MRTNTPLACLLQEYIQKHGLSLDYLAGKSKVPKQTIHRWLQGTVRKPQMWQDLVQVARVLGLKKAQTTALLHAANYPSIDTLLAQTISEADKALLSPWTAPVPNNLPSPVTTFIGRGTEINQLMQVLDKARLITLTGPGGSGKTRLALHVATELLDMYPDGVFLVNLSSITDPALVVPTIARTLSVSEASNEPLGEQLKAYLHPKRLLLLLDNFEQVLPAAPEVTDLLKAAPHLTVLVTSRVPLHVYGEYEVPIPPLPVPDPHAAFRTLAANPAVMLFAQRAQATNIDFELTPTSAPAVAEICTCLDGLPLAIELAAARSKRFTPHELLAQFPSRLDLGAEGPVDVPQRHQALRWMIEWSYNLLQAGEQSLFQQLAVFVGGWTAAAARIVCAGPGDGQRAVHDSLTALIEHNLVHQRAGVGNEPRFAMLETIREYALERLIASPAYRPVRHAHATYYLRLAEAAAPELTGSQQAVWVAQLEQDYGNLRSALQWSLEQNDVETALRFGAALWRFWNRGLYLSEGRHFLEQALSRSTTVPASLRAAALSVAGQLAHTQNDWTQATRLYSESLAMYQQLEDHQGIADALSHLGLVAMAQRDFAEAAHLNTESLALFRHLGDKQGTADALLHLAWTELFTGNFEQARVRAEESLALGQELGHATGVAASLTVLGLVAFYSADYQAATPLLREAFQMYQEVGDRIGLSTVLMQQGYIALFQGHHADAVRLFYESLILQKELKDKLVIAYCLDGLAAVAGLSNQPVRAVRLGGAGEALRQQMNVTLNPVDRALYERIVAVTRPQLDAATWAAAWAEGQAMSLDQAIAYAFAADDPTS